MSNIISPKFLRKRSVSHTLAVFDFDASSSEDFLGEIFAETDASKADDRFSKKPEMTKRHRPTRPAGTPATTPSRPIIRMIKGDATARLMRERAIAIKHHTEE